MTNETLAIGSRRSKLAVVQAEYVKKLVEEAFRQQYNCTITTTQTLGDQIQFKPLYSFGGKALWTKELEDLLYSKNPETRLDMIVHSLKDMPTLLPDGFILGGITKREDPSDCLVMPRNSPHRSIQDLPAGSVVGTSSVRRSAQLKKNFPHLKFESVRGNIHTRINKVDDPDSPYSCIILATAGLVRMGLENRITQKFDSSIMYHAVGQGALGIEIKENDTRMQKILQEISDLDSTICCFAERSLMRTLEGGCSVPIGVNSNYNEETKILTLNGIVIDCEGTKYVEESIQYKINDIQKDSIQCGKLLAEKMIKLGAKQILDEINLNKLA